jgi:hypothetical protein
MINPRILKKLQRKYKLDYNIASDNGKRDRARKKNFLAQMEQIKRHNNKKDNGFFQELNEFSVLVRFRSPIRDDVSRALTLNE